MNGCLDDLQRELHAMRAGLDALAVQQRPAGRSDAWSIQQIAEHLSRTYGATIAAFEDRMVKGRCTRMSASMKQLLGQFYITKLGRFPEGRVAPEAVTPRPALAIESGDAIYERLAARIAAMQVLLARTERAFGPKRRCTSHMVLGPMSVEGWRRFHWVHGQHHLKQMAAIRTEVLGAQLIASRGAE